MGAFMKRAIVQTLAVAASLAAGSVAVAADAPVTVSGLLSQGYTVVGSITSPIGPGLFLVKGPSLYACFVVETPTSADLKTRYCKPVH
jgi:hypothetical protein